ncbi:MAG: TonB-dependent receptor [Gammaproteobacteria bacterium]|nr:TonB-dependent receptor [Gammaproteobacteria bacterium]
MSTLNTRRSALTPTLLAVSVAAALAPYSMSSQAQGAAGAEEIFVTGSRIVRRDYESPSPIMTVESEAIQNSGFVTIERTLNELPQFTRDASGGQGTGGRALLDLRGLGANRNLLLLDGRRLPISSSLGQVDSNILPTGIIGNIETITGGASAVYGSDAMSGVINFLTPRNFEGVKVDVQYGDTFDSAQSRFQGTATLGGHFDEDRGYALLSVSRTDQDPLWGVDRADFFALGIPSSFIGQGTYVPSANNRPDQAAVNALFGGYGATAPLNNNNFGFNDDGTLFGQNGASNYRGPIDLGYQIIGGNVRMPVLIQGTQRPSIERTSVYAKGEYTFSDALTGYVQVLYTDHTANTNSGGTLTQFGTPTIPVTNPFIPVDLATLLAARPDPTASFGYNSRYVMVPAKNWDENYITQQYIGGFKGDLSFKDWSYDVYVAFDDTRHNQTQNYAVFLSRVQTLFNAPDGGDSICDGGYNPFGLANVLTMSQECQDYIAGETHSVEKLTRTMVEGSLQGTLMELPAGPLQFSASVNYRKDNFSFSPDSRLAEQDVQAVIAASGSEGSINVKEFGIETAIPVLRDSALGQSLTLNAAFRYSDYNLSGGTETYKLDALWNPVDSVLVRGGYQRAIRAPNIGELYSAATGGQVGFGNPPAGGEPCDIRTAARANDTSGNLRQLCIDMGVPAGVVDAYIFPTTATASLSSGNLGLKPEKADTFTGGFVFTPEFSAELLSDVSISIDYFHIKIKDVISVIPGLTALNKCHNLDGSNPGYDTNNTYCQLITRDANGFLDLIRTPYLNLGKLKTDGVDIQVGWTFGLGALGMDDSYGDIFVNSNVTWVNSFEIQTLPGESTVDEAGTIGFFATPRPEIRALTTFGWRRGPLTLSMRWQHIDSMTDRSLLTNPNSTTPGVSSYDKFDLNGRYAFSDTIELRAGITNLFDKDPLVVAGAPGITDTQSYDIVGRSFYLGATLSF